MVFSILTDLCNHYHKLILEFFHHPEENLLAAMPYSPLPPVLGNHLSTFAICTSAYYEHFIEKEYNICLLVAASFT